MAIDVSAVVPVYNEVENVEALYSALRETLDGTGQSWEMIVVDDGSTDGSSEAIRRICDRDGRVQLIRFRRNFGQTAALAAGLEEASGAVIITMDGDLQNDPADIPVLLSKIEEGYDLVNGWRKGRRDPFFSRRLPSLIANKVISWITGVRLHDFGCTLKAIRREIASDLRLYGEMHRFIPAIAHQVGASVIEIPVRHRPRLAGASKYGIGRLFRVIVDLITVKFLSEYATRPGHAFGLLGLLAMVVGSSVTGYLVLEKIFLKTELAGRPLLLLSIFLAIIGVQFITMGLIGEMLSRVYHESQRKPIYAIRERYRRDRVVTAEVERVTGEIEATRR